jgi:hypothetical protein
MHVTLGVSGSTAQILIVIPAAKSKEAPPKWRGFLMLNLTLTPPVQDVLIDDSLDLPAELPAKPKHK